MQLDASIGFDTTLAEIPELVRRAERVGFGAVWTAETRHDPFLPLALAADVTDRVGLGTNVAVAFARSPTVTAMTAWDLADRSGGRFILGLGTQVRAHIERRFAMPWSGHPAAQLRDYVGAVRAVWQSWAAGEPLDYRSPHYTVTLMTPFFSPPPMQTPRAIPIFLAGVGPTMCSLAGEIGDGLVVHPLHSVRYLTDVVVPSVVAGAARLGRQRSDVQLSGSVLVAIGDEREKVRQEIAFYASTPTYRGLLALHGWAEIGANLSELARNAKWSEMPLLVTDDMLDTFAITVDGWDDLAPRLLGRYRGLLDRIALYRPFDSAGDDAGWERLLSGLNEPEQKDIGV